MKQVVVITGQTATGKTSYALQLANEKNGELINCDSRQLYKHLNIITGKDIPNASSFMIHASFGAFDVGFYLLDKVRIWLYDVVDPKLPFSSFDYKELAMKVIDDIILRGKTPILVGGSYLYIKHLLYGFDRGNIPPDWELRNKLEEVSVEELQKKLSKIDKNRLEQMNNSDRNNPRRLIRKIEILCHSGKRSAPRIDSGQARMTNETIQVKNFVGFRFADTSKLGETIKKRVYERVEQGAEEVKNVLKMGYTKHDPGLNTIGYKEIIAYLEGKMNKQAAIERWILSEIQYAKRQYTFMKKDKNIIWKLI